MNFLESAVEIAKEMGEIQLNGLGKMHNVEYKDVTDIVTEVDKKCERIFIERIQKKFSDHEILGEEGGRVMSGVKSDYCWIVDPLDGTINYAHTYPVFCASIALQHKGEVVLGVVFDPNRNELFAAEKGQGATLNGRRISVSQTKDIRKALLDTGFAYNTREEEKRDNIVHFENFLFEARAIRRDGAAASDLCSVACGRFDGFWELYLKPWDVAAGQVIVKEAGGRISMFDGSAFDLFGMELVASNGLIHDKMVEVLMRGRCKK